MIVQDCCDRASTLNFVYDDAITYLTKERGYNPIHAATILDGIIRGQKENGEPVSLREVYHLY